MLNFQSNPVFRAKFSYPQILADPCLIIVLINKYQQAWSIFHNTAKGVRTSSTKWAAAPTQEWAWSILPYQRSPIYLRSSLAVSPSSKDVFRTSFASS